MGNNLVSLRNKINVELISCKNFRQASSGSFSLDL